MTPADLRIPSEPELSSFAIGDYRIPFNTGVPLIDADPDEVTRVLAGKPWSERAFAINNAVSDSLECGVLIFDGMEDGQGTEVLHDVLAGIHERITDVLDRWGKPEPMDRHAAALYLLSLSPHHRLAGREFFPVGTLPNIVEFEGYQALAMFNRASLVARPGMTIAWRHRDGLLDSAA